MSLEAVEAAGAAGGTGGVPEVDLLALDEALEDLAQIDERQARIVEMRYFGGCGVEEIAELLGAGKRTVDREWSAARAWLFARLGGDRDPGEGGPW